MITRLLCAFFCVCCVALTDIAGVAAESLAGAPSDADVARLESVVETSNLAIEEKSELTEQLTVARRILAEIKERDAGVDGFVSTMTNAEVLRAEIAAQRTAVEAKSLDRLERMTSEDLQNELGLIIAERDSIGKNLALLQTRQTALVERSSVIAASLAEARAKLNDFQETLTVAAPEEPGIRSDVSAFMSQVRLFELQSAVEALQREQPTIPSRQSILAARIALEQLRLDFAGRRIVFVQSKLAASRIARAEQAIAEAAADVAKFGNAAPEIADLARENLTLAETLKSIAERSSKSERDITRLKSDGVSIQQSNETVQRVLAAGSLTDELGELLRHVRDSLPDTERLARVLAANEEAHIAEQLNIILWQERLRRLADPPIAAEHAGESAGTESDPAGGDQAERALGLAHVLAGHRALLTELLDAARTQSDYLADKQIIGQGVLSDARNLNALLDRRLLWLPSNTGVSGSLRRNIMASAVWLLSPSPWLKSLDDFLQTVTTNPVRVAFFGFCRARCSRCAARLSAPCRNCRRGSATSAGMTIGRRRWHSS